MSLRIIKFILSLLFPGFQKMSVPLFRTGQHARNSRRFYTRTQNDRSRLNPGLVPQAGIKEAFQQFRTSFDHQRIQILSIQILQDLRQDLLPEINLHILDIRSAFDFDSCKYERRHRAIQQMRTDRQLQRPVENHPDWRTASPMPHSQRRIV